MNVEVHTENMVKCNKSLIMGAIINRHNTRELNMESDVYTPLRRPNIPLQENKGMSGVITKYDAQ